MFLCSASITFWNFLLLVVVHINKKNFVFLVCTWEKSILFLFCGCFIFIFSSIQYCFQFEFIALDIGFIASEIYLLKRCFEIPIDIESFFNTLI
jgi:hypothetical protein